MNASIHAVAKRYRYTGKERDEESGLYYHRGRYYLPWLARWSAVDPLESKYAGMSPYNYGFNNPVIFNDPSGMEGEEVKFQNGYTVNTILLDIKGEPMPDGTKVSYSSQDPVNPSLHEHIKNIGKGEIEVGINVIKEAKGGGRMLTQTVKYRVVKEATQHSPARIRLIDYPQSYEESIIELPQPTLSEPTPTTEPKQQADTPIEKKTTPVKPKTQPKPLPPPPQMRSVSANEITGLAIWRGDLSQQGYEYMLGLVKELKGTNLGSIDITFGIPSNVNQGTVIRSGEGRFENINPRTQRVTTQSPMITRPIQATGNMDVRNIEAQGRELQIELSRRLNVPVRLRFNYNSSSGVQFLFTPQRR